MKIKINDKILSFPPYLSTTWDQVKSLRVDTDPSLQSDLLVITLLDGSSVKIPNLDKNLIHTVFTAHLKSIEHQTESKEIRLRPVQAEAFLKESAKMELPVQFGVMGLDGLNSALQHNPHQADSPLLPQEILSKIAAITKILNPADQATLPQPERHCNCIHCQIARAIQEGISEEEIHEEEEVVSDEDLKFRLWDIAQDGDKLYTVTNPIDPNERYHVYLGDPIGCTCGQKNCEHIRSVLNS